MKDARCLKLGDEGYFCGGDCNGIDCPDGYTCEQVEDTEGRTSRQCVKEDNFCDCSALAISQSAETTCSVVSAFGTCEATRKCEDGGLTACDTEPPTEEICDGKDNDCDETTEDGVNDPKVGTECDGEDADLCADGTYSCDVDAGELVCSDDAETKKDLCDGIDNDCDGKIDETL